MLTYDNIDIIVNGSGILAQSAQISSNNSLDGIYSVGKKNINSIAPNGPIQSNIKIDYYPETNWEPSYLVVQQLKNLSDDGRFTGAILDIGGITGTNCYLESYSLNVNPNDLVRASVGYVCYQPLSGEIHTKRNNITYNKSGAVANSWSVFVTTSGNCLTSKIGGMNYDFNAEWEPIYNIGQTNPVQVTFLGATERMSFVRDSFNLITFSGQNATGIIAQTGNNILIYDIKFLCENTRGNARNLVFDMSGSKIISSNLDIKVDGYLTTNSEIVNYY